jgi:hypothetical protein
MRLSSNAIENLIIAAALVVFLSLTSGCSSMFTAKTKATYTTTRPDGTKTEVVYESDKQQEGLYVKFGDVLVKVANASTQEEVIAAVLQSQATMLLLLDKLTSVAKAGALSGS